MKSMVEPVLRKVEYKERATMIDDYHANTGKGYMGIDSVRGVGIRSPPGHSLLQAPQSCVCVFLGTTG